MPFISKSELATLLSKINIINVLKSFIHLKKSGNGYFANCPFHEEKTPSFFVSEKKQKYYCFGCHRSGNIISFLIKYKSMRFIEAINFLLKRTKNKNIQNICKEISIYYITKIITKLYNKNLIVKWYYNNKLLNFLHKRNLNFNIIKRFQVGFVDDTWNFLSKNNHLSQNIKSKLELLGLLIKKEKIIYDRFRNRVIFPIRNINGETVGFGARTLDDNLKPKYINSPESKIFSKKNEFYGIYEAKIYNDTHVYIIVVEGYLDVISLNRHGITNVVAVLGTFFSKNHFKILKLLYKKIIFCFDGDKAGQNASLRTAYSCLSYADLNIFIGFMILPQKHDPDSYINEYGKISFLSKMNKATYILDYLYNITSLKYGKDYLAHKLYDITNHIKNPFSKKFMLNYFADKLINKPSKIFNNFDKKKINDTKMILLGIRGCLLILKQRNLINTVNINKLIINKNIKFASDVHAFLELIIVLKKNMRIKFHYLKRKMLNQVCLPINIKSLSNLNDKNILNEFVAILNRIINYGK